MRVSYAHFRWGRVSSSSTFPNTTPKKERLSFWSSLIINQNSLIINQNSHGSCHSVNGKWDPASAVSEEMNVSHHPQKLCLLKWLQNKSYKSRVCLWFFICMQQTTIESGNVSSTFSAITLLLWFLETEEGTSS